MQHNVNTPYTYREEGVKIFEKPLKGAQDFLVKMEGSPCREFSIEEGQALLFSVWIFWQWYSLLNKSFVENVIFFLILLIHDIYRYYFGSYLSLILLLKVLHIKGHVFYFSKNEQILLPHEFIFVFIIGTILSKCIAKKGNGHVGRLYLCTMCRSRQPLLNFFVTTVHIN